MLDLPMQRGDKWVRFMEPHARSKMQERGLSKQQVESVLRRPDTIRRAKGGRLRFEKELSRKRRLAVIVKETPDWLIVITAFVV